MSGSGDKPRRCACHLCILQTWPEALLLIIIIIATKHDLSIVRYSISITNYTLLSSHLEHLYIFFVLREPFLITLLITISKCVWSCFLLSFAESKIITLGIYRHGPHCTQPTHIFISFFFTSHRTDKDRSNQTSQHRQKNSNKKEKSRKNKQVSITTAFHKTRKDKKG